ncbi:hypothetical protein UFOVP1375_46 [uncultured Caudovirales phage]|uniref:Uncharacterized protein n=1 Tax=uncultured Caudovirales phage TaxID=2100421 RepID=A0A6J5RWV6_9CAUD|nr:hypothetical protein UFOVP1107_5 [uncultured Caudovirales phage]CAB4187948.1 hypothetical protein UFOVP1171_31 [uncultured Caudovirales phage]CAB4202922.1 hypothetical protein UFOVP1375_46 [uncultured Caudovirales phage]CAB4214853.1 hypothetical protein UFOVP1471_51 [uncultured Caudovirales phage]
MPFLFKTKNKSNPAYRVICMLGGVRPTARIVDVSPSAVSRWMMPAASGGTGGRIPQRHWQTIINHANKTKLNIRLNDLSDAR